MLHKTWTESQDTFYLISPDKKEFISFQTLDKSVITQKFSISTDTTKILPKVPVGKANARLHWNHLVLDGWRRACVIECDYRRFEFRAAYYDELVNEYVEF